MEPALAILIGHHAIGLVHFIRLVRELIAQILHTDLRQLVQLILQHGIAPIIVIQVEHALLLYYKLVVILYRPHLEGLNIHEIQLV